MSRLLKNFARYAIVTLMLALAANAGERNLSWLRGKIPNGALANSSNGIWLTKVSSGKPQKVGTGSYPEFSTKGSFLAWKSGGDAMVLLRHDGSTRKIISGISGHVSWVSDTEIVVYTSKWLKINVLTRKLENLPDVQSLIGSPISGEDDLKMTEDGKWVILTGQSIKSNASDASNGKSVPGDCSGSLSPYGKSMTGLQHSHTSCKYTSVRSGGPSGSISYGQSCSGKGFDNHRFSSTSDKWIVSQNECGSDMVIHDRTTADYCHLGQTEGQKPEAYGDFTHLGPAITSWGGSGPTKYKLTVQNGSGDGSYEAGTQVEIIADAPPASQVFDQWTGDVSHVTDLQASKTKLTMPASDVTVTATYKALAPGSFPVTKSDVRQIGISVAQWPGGRHRLSVYLPSSGAYSLWICDVHGRHVAKYEGFAKAASRHLILPETGLHQGVFTAVFKLGNRRMVHRFVIVE